jgi:tetratricopeptide (TPR) repeat protein
MRYHMIHKHSEQGSDAFNKTMDIDPSWSPSINSYAYFNAFIGNFEKAVYYAERYISMLPDDANPYDTMGDINLMMGRLDEALNAYQKAMNIKQDFSSSIWDSGYINALKEDYETALNWIERLISLAPSHSERSEGFLWKSLYHLWLGDIDRSLNTLQMAKEVSNIVGNEYWLACVNWMNGWILYHEKQFDLAREAFRKWAEFIIEYPALYMPTPSRSYYRAEYITILGLIDLKQDRIASAESRLTEINSMVNDIQPYFKDWVRFLYDLFHGELLLAKGSFQEAINCGENLIQPGIYFPVSQWMIPYNGFYPRDVLARTYYQNNELEKAIAEYERLITFDPNSKDRSLINPVYHYLLAELYEEKGFKDKAIEQYEKFLDIWKDADEDLPELIDAKTRLARLKDEG